MPGVKKEEKVETLSLDDEGPSGTAAAPSTNKKSGEVDILIHHSFNFQMTSTYFGLILEIALKA